MYPITTDFRIKTPNITDRNGRRGTQLFKIRRGRREKSVCVKEREEREKQSIMAVVGRQVHERLPTPSVPRLLCSFRKKKVFNSSIGVRVREIIDNHGTHSRGAAVLRWFRTKHTAHSIAELHWPAQD